MIKYTCGAGTPEEAETNCTYFIRGECTASFCEYRRKKQTRADKIRAMSDEELAEWMSECNAYRENAIASQWLPWLQEPCEGGRTMTGKDLEVQCLRRALRLTQEMYDKQLEVNEQLYSINELLASENAALKTEIEKIGRMNDGEE